MGGVGGFRARQSCARMQCTCLTFIGRPPLSWPLSNTALAAAAPVSKVRKPEPVHAAWSRCKVFPAALKGEEPVQAAAYHALGPTWRCHHSLLQESGGLGRRC